MHFLSYFLHNVFELLNSETNHKVHHWKTTIVFKLCCIVGPFVKFWILSIYATILSQYFDSTEYGDMRLLLEDTVEA